MSKIKNNFINLLKDISYPTKKQEQEELWNVEGVLKKRLNQKFKFDTRALQRLNTSSLQGKEGSTETKADKIVYEEKNKWIIVDVEELHNYIYKNKITRIFLEDLTENLEWNIIINK